MDEVSRDEARELLKGACRGLLGDGIVVSGGGVTGHTFEICALIKYTGKDKIAAAVNLLAEILGNQNFSVSFMKQGSRFTSIEDLGVTADAAIFGFKETELTQYMARELRKCAETAKPAPARK